MRHHFISVGKKLFLGLATGFLAYYVVHRSNFYYLFLANVLLTISCAFLAEVLWSFLFPLIKGLEKRKEPILRTTRSTFVILFLAEIIIRLSGIMQTYPERADNRYFSQAQNEKLDSWYWVHPPNDTIENRKREFVFYRETNSLGLSEREIEKEKGQNFRILAIGDSFTEGVGLAYEKSWVKTMEKRWSAQKVESINGGIGGSDPVYEFALYRDKLAQYDPDIVILTINSTDIMDIGTRGGFERFRSDGTAGKEAPSWEWIYASNHLVRMFSHKALKCNSSLIVNGDSEKYKKEALTILKDVTLRMKKLTKENGAKLLIVFQPSVGEFENGKNIPFYGQVELERFAKANGIQSLNASPAFAKKGKNVKDYYWPIDTHFNQKGYALFGETIYAKIESLDWLPKTTE